MILSKLLSSLDGYQIYGDSSVEVSFVTADSREVNKGALFVAIRGQNIDANDFISDVIKKGAVVVVTEKDVENDVHENVTYVKVVNARRALGVIASAWYGNPSEKLKIIGVTGTDGKTTTVNLIYTIIKEAGIKVGMVSTINAKIGDREIDTGFHVTNPDQILLQKLLSDMVNDGCEYAVLEVTSHGLDQERVAGISFDIGVLTNITHEHLDYHKTYENYLLTKAKLFETSETSVLNEDDASYKTIIKILKGKTKIISYCEKCLSDDLLDVVKNKFPEKYNQMNAAAAIKTAELLGIDHKSIIDAINNFSGITGRMEEINNTKRIKIIIDFAHTPNALKSVLTALKEKCGGKLIAVVGSAGERDNEKRKLMGEIAGDLADITILTAEDPRSEDVNDIIDQMETGVMKNAGAEYFKIPERGEAIFEAINNIAKMGDTIVICGKGHEKSMCYKGVEYPWTDHEAVTDALTGKIKRIIRNG
jgi:UDP-N-acetylmuramoyl-L-alanyl-D-glutamate--2,6-diaminopimelate ligase